MSRGFNTTTALGRAMLAAGWTAADFSARTGINSRTLTEYLSGRRVMLREHLWAAERISDQLPYGDWTCGRWAWRLDDIVKLREPVAARGRQGVWRPDESLVAACEESSP